MHQALYRKYRPRNFNDVVGQTAIIKTLQNSIIHHKFCHAYMFFGPRGTGKTSISKIFARAVNCLNSIDGSACGKCNNCLKSSEKECVDIIEIDAASNNGVDEIRELRNKISLVPAELKYKVYIIDEVHMLSMGAFNALLKTLEEPPEHAIFILATTDPQKVPETIVSRCQCFSFKRISENMIVQQLKHVCLNERIEIDDDVLMEIAISSDGGMRDSLGLLDKVSSYSTDRITMELYTELNGLISKTEIQLLIHAIFTNNVVDVLEMINKFNDCGKNIIQILVQLMYSLRDLMVDYYMRQQSISYSIENIEELITIINEKMFDIKRSGNPKVYIEVLLLKYMNSLGKFISREIKRDEANSLVEEDVAKSVIPESIEKTEIHISTNTSVDQCDSKNVEDIEKEQEYSSNYHVNSEILNLAEIMQVRVNNAMALANKQILKQELAALTVLNDFTFDQEIGYLVCEILNSKFRVASDEILVLSYEYDSIVEQNLTHLEQMEEVYAKLTNSNKRFAIISDKEWDTIKNEYIESLKNGEHFTVKEEPDKVFKKEENNDIISNSAIHLFGDIVEID